MNSISPPLPASASALAHTLIRPSHADDIPAICAIYRRHVEEGTGTFELEAPDATEIAARRMSVLERGLPWLVAERGGVLLGYAYAAPFRAREAYRYCLEDSVYVAADACGQGLGRLLLAELLARCEALGARQMVGVIGDAGNRASIALHRAAGFREAGVLEAAGWKQGRWLDVVLMQKRIGPGATQAPRGEPAAT
jgi:phosphinothricin acetyltransferase